MNPGDVRTFNRGDGKAVVLGVGLWAEKSASGEQIEIHIKGAGECHTTVTSDPNSEGYHPTLFRDLRKVLVENQCWPFGSEGPETESVASTWFE